jgi:ABC-2 type transport system ATP-binding protein
MTSDTFAIQTDSLEKQYGDVTAIDGVDLEVPHGSIYGFLGPNGAGKTTTIKLLVGLLEPSDGTAEVQGIDVQNRESLIGKIGYAHETPPLYPNLTGREQLNCVAEVRGLSDAEDDIERYLDLFDLRDAEDRRIKSYSKGMKQKLNLTQAILHDPEVLFLDEPTSGLDPQSARDVRELLTELTSSETTVFLSTHILSVVEELADEVGILHDGQIVEAGPVGTVIDQTQGSDLEDVFLELTERRKEPA